jgi:hypothetical protein
VTSAPNSPREFFKSYLPTWFGNSAGGATSPGSVVFHVGSESYALRLRSGNLLVDEGTASDAILQVSLAESDFAELVAQSSALFAAGERDRLLALRSLSLDEERANLVRNVDGSVAFEITENGNVRTLLLSPGAGSASSATPACTVRIAAGDFWALSRGEKNPFELLMDGKIRMQGRMDVAMALSSVLLG